MDNFDTDIIIVKEEVDLDEYYEDEYSAEPQAETFASTVIQVEVIENQQLSDEWKKSLKSTPSLHVTKESPSSSPSLAFKTWLARDDSYTTQGKCCTCKKSFNDLKIHLYTHMKLDEKLIVESGWKFVCYFCDKRFRAPSILEAHVSVHTTETPFKCGLCRKSYTRRSSLNVHVKSHSKNISVRRSYKCHLCAYRFAVKSHLTVHLKYHKGKKVKREHKCGYCSRWFVLKSHVKLHVNNVHLGIRYPCKYCGDTFTQKGQARIHEKGSVRCIARRNKGNK